MDFTSLKVGLADWLVRYDRATFVEGVVRAAPVLSFGDKSRWEWSWGAHRNAVQALRDVAKPARFGMGSETRLDASIRSGLQVDAPDVTVESLPLGDILAQLTAWLGTTPRAELHGVQLYEAGDHFVSHRDTPRGPDHIGTLVVALPSPHSGGEFKIEGTTRSWGTVAEALPWIAFYGDVEHEVLPVREGTRVTVSFDLFAAQSRNAAEQPELDGLFHAAMSSEELEPRGARLALPCTHLYGLDRNQAAAREITLQTASELKGAERAIAEAALNASLKVTLAPALAANDGDAQPLTEIGPLARSLNPREIRSLSKGKALSEVSLDDLQPYLLEFWSEALERHTSVSTRHLFRCLFSSSGYFGNEASEAFVYTFTVLLIDLPPVDERPFRQAHVRHAKFGEGRTVKSDGDVCTVRFSDGTVRQVRADKLQHIG